MLSQVPLAAVARDAEARRLQGVNPRSDERKAATGAFGLSPSAQRPTRFCAPACADSLDLPSRAGCSPELGGPRVAHRLLQSSRPASTPCERSEPSGTCLRSDLPPVAHPPLAGMASRVASNQGSPGDLSPFRPPRKRPLAARIYPDSLRSEHPLVARLTPPAAGNPLTAAIYGSDPSEEDQLALANQTEVWPRPRPWLAFRAAVPLGHANGATVDCTQGAFRLPILASSRSRRAFREGWWLSRAGFPGVGRPGHTTPFSPARPPP